MQQSMILLDIEGTTTDIDFVHKVLFPYAKEKLEEFVSIHSESMEVKRCLADGQRLLQKELGVSVDIKRTVAGFLQWIDEDRKVTPLKEIQGLIWKEGYLQGDFLGHVYDDVELAFKKWKNEDVKIAIYSSGSIAAQKLIFGYTPFGDLNPYISDYFDTNIGSKRSSDSYRKIAESMKFQPSQITFVSDMPQELEAATEAGFKVVHSLRPGVVPCTRYPEVTDLLQVRF